MRPSTGRNIHFRRSACMERADTSAPASSDGRAFFIAAGAEQGEGGPGASLSTFISTGTSRRHSAKKDLSIIDAASCDDVRGNVVCEYVSCVQSTRSGFQKPEKSSEVFVRALKKSSGRCSRPSPNCSGHSKPRLNWPSSQTQQIARLHAGSQVSMSHQTASFWP